MMPPVRPKVNILSQELVHKIIDEALVLLERIGVFVENEEARTLLAEAGAKIGRSGQRVYLPPDLVKSCLEKAPGTIHLYDREGKRAFLVGGDEVHFNPGSAAISFLDAETQSLRPPVTQDLIKLTRLTELLPHLDFQSTALVPSDVPQEMADSYRLYVALLFSSKPVVTGTFRRESFKIMKDMLVAVRGSEAELRAKPLAIFDACPSPPLKWSDLTAQSLIDAARCGQPSELISMGLTGATSPVTITGTLVQHVAENLAGLVIVELAEPGAPVIFGGSPSSFDLRYGTTPMGAVETMMIDMAAAQIGKELGLPTHAYMGLSDAKIIDYQAGLETANGALLAALAGINVISGPGMLAFESAQSLEKLLIDDAICGQALRLIEGIAQRDEPMALFFFEQQGEWPNFLAHPHTRKWYRQEHRYFPLLDRNTYEAWVAAGRKDIAQRAKEEVSRLLTSSSPNLPPPEILKELTRLMKSEARLFGLESLPFSA
jgi:trimethylamine--corrinoid protein Co-methyltransferase